MGLILCIETATKTCSVAVSKDGLVIAHLDFKSEKYSHSERLNGMIQEVMDTSGVPLKEIDAVAVSEGPGSYTGLRIGVSTAKGLCYALDRPLIAINSLKGLASLCSEGEMLLCPMFDARRMEVYSAVFNPSLRLLEPTTAVIIEEDSYTTFLEKGKVRFFGPGAEKCQDKILHPNAIFDLITAVSARGMARLAEEKYQANQIENLAYFEPFYLKDFVAGKPKKLL